MRHSAEIVSGLYSIEHNVNGVWYHHAESKNHAPPTLKKIVRYVTDRWHFSDGTEYVSHWKRPVTIWKRGWHHIKGARKKARLRRQNHERGD